MNLLKARQEFNSILSTAGIEDVANNVNRLIEYVTGLNKVDILLTKDISDQDYAKLKELVDKRATGYPFQYIIGKVEFCGNEIMVKENVLIPRNETEQLCDMIAKTADNKKVLDMCTGTGCIGLGIKANSLAKVTLSDISDYAIDLATINRDNNNLEVDIVKSDLFDNISGMFDIIVSNPPYIPTCDLAGLQAEVQHEPTLALDGKEDGLYFYKIIIANAPHYLENNGEIYLEYGIGQAESIKKLLSKDFECIRIIKDYYNIERFVYAKLKERLC